MRTSWPALSVGYVPDVPEALTFIDNRQIESALSDVTDGLIRVYQQEFENVDAVDTGKTKRSVRKRGRGRFEKEVVADTPALVIEHGWIKRARGQDSYPGRWPAGRAVVLLGPVVEQAFDRQMRR